MTRRREEIDDETYAASLRSEEHIPQDKGIALEEVRVQFRRQSTATNAL